jgi:hypothetical protein
MFFELRQYRIKAGQMERWVKFMDEVLIPFQASKGMIIVGSFVSPDEDDLYTWIRRFEDEADKERLYKAVYESDEWLNHYKPIVGEMNDREKIKVTRLEPTARSIIR